MARASTREEFIEKAKKIHGSKYDYSNVVYKGNKIHVEIICPEHGPFWQRPDSHVVRGQGCPFCGLEKKNRNPYSTELALMMSSVKEILLHTRIGQEF